MPNPSPNPTLGDSQKTPPISNLMDLKSAREIEEDSRELGWSNNNARRSPLNDLGLGSESSIPTSSSSQFGSSSDIFSSLPNSMSTDYTFKPSEQTIKAAEAKRLADSQQVSFFIISIAVIT
jgi:hypothetical protein